MVPKLLPIEQQLGQPERSTDAALFAKRGQHGFGNSRGQNGAGGSGPQRQQQKESRRSFYCGRKGHVQKDCRKKKSDIANGGGAQRRPQYSAIALTAGSKAAAENSNSHHMRWVLDTGASRHITPDRSVLYNMRPMEELVTITFGNGGTGKGSNR